MAKGYKLIKNDYYPTAPSHVWPLLKLVQLRGRVWECASGKDHIVDVLRKDRHASLVIGSDITKGVDFLNQRSLPHHAIRTILTNPPYSHGLADDFVRHALDLTRPVGGMVCMLLKVKFDCGTTRHDIFRDHPAYRAKLILTERMLIPGFKHRAQPRDNHAWYVWDWKWTKPTELHYA